MCFRARQNSVNQIFSLSISTFKCTFVIFGQFATLNWGLHHYGSDPSLIHAVIVANILVTVLQWLQMRTREFTASIWGHGLRVSASHRSKLTIASHTASVLDQWVKKWAPHSYGSPCVYKAGWCARQGVRIPCWWELTNSKQPLSRNCWLVWLHLYDSVFMYATLHYVARNLTRT